MKRLLCLLPLLAVLLLQTEQGFSAPVDQSGNVSITRVQDHPLVRHRRRVRRRVRRHIRRAVRRNTELRLMNDTAAA